MIGFFDYTVWLTYLSLISASVGIVVSLNGAGHPFWGVFFLLISGLCDTFDGRVARTKKERTTREKAFGVQIDSLADLVAFGVLPACIGNAMIRVIPTFPEEVRRHSERLTQKPYYWGCVAIMVFYILAALIRLAYFNVTEEERQKVETGCRKYYEGLPVTNAALIFPTILALQYLLPQDVTRIYFVALFLTGIAFILRFRIPKIGLKGILILVGIGAVEFIVLLVRSGILF